MRVICCLPEDDAEFDPFLRGNGGANSFKPSRDDVIPEIDGDDFVRDETKEPIETLFDMRRFLTVAHVPSSTYAGIRRRPR